MLVSFSPNLKDQELITKRCRETLPENVDQGGGGGYPLVVLLGFFCPNRFLDDHFTFSVHFA